MILIVGESPLVESLAEQALAANQAVSLYLVEQLADAEALDQLFEEVRAADVLIEAHNESKVAKRRAFEVLERALPAERLILVSCLACSATEVASWATHPERVVGWGAVPPLAAGGLIEIAPALQTALEHTAAAEAFVRTLGLEPVIVADGPGLVRARVVCCLINEAITGLGEQIASAEDIDIAMRLGTNYPRGPLAWADLIGLDVVYGVLLGLQDEYGEDRYRPAPLLRRMVQAGYLGQKSGQGFFEYNNA